jgi:Domain of unknown function (DUF1844)
VEVLVSDEGKALKITDKRMFTADGELREEYRFLDQKTDAAVEPAAGAVVDAANGATAAGSAGGPGAGPGLTGSIAAPSPDRQSGGVAMRDDAAPQPARPADRGDRGEPADYGASARLELPGAPPGLGPTFYDLASVLAEPIPVYLGDVELPDGQSAENIEAARLYIDLLDVLRQKTAGNLTGQESAFLEDLLYRSRVRYVQKRG